MSQQAPSQEKPHCRYCGKELYGRLGKMFCNVDCKNNYNSRIRSAQRAEENKRFPEVIKTIKNNYRILTNYKLEELSPGGTLTRPKSELRALGFDDRYCTGAVLDYNEKLWKCCFTFCWHEEQACYSLKYDRSLNSKHKYYL